MGRALDGFAEHPRPERLEFIQIRRRGEELVFCDIAIMSKLAAHAQRFAHLFRHFLGGRNEQHIVTDNAADKRFKHGVMRAAKHERVDFATTQRFKIVAGDFLERRANVNLARKAREVFDGASRHANSLLDDVDELRRSRGKHRDARVDIANSLRIAARFNRALRGDDAHAAVFRRRRERQE